MQINEGRSAGEDGIMPETLKRADVDRLLLMFSNKLLIEKQAPEHFSTLNIVPVPKKSDLRLTGNYSDQADQQDDSDLNSQLARASTTREPSSFSAW